MRRDSLQFARAAFRAGTECGGLGRQKLTKQIQTENYRSFGGKLYRICLKAEYGDTSIYYNDSVILINF